MTYVPPDERRKQFIAAASVVIKEVGLGKATTRRIAQEANAPLGALHYCFRNKEELFEAVSQTLGDEGLECVAENVRQGMGVRNATVEILGSMARWIAETADTQVGEFEFYVWGMRNEGYGHMPKSVYNKWFSRICELLQQAADQTDAGIDLEAVSRTIVALGDGFSLRDQIKGESTIIDDIAPIVDALAMALDNGAFRTADVRS